MVCDRCIYIFIVIYIFNIIYSIFIYVDTGIYEPTNKKHLEGIKFWIPRLSQRRPRYRSVFFSQKSLVFPIQMCSSLPVNPGNQFQINSATSTKIIKNRRILPSLTMIGGVQLDMNHLAQPGPRPQCLPAVVMVLIE